MEELGSGECRWEASLCMTGLIKEVASDELNDTFVWHQKSVSLAYTQLLVAEMSRGEPSEGARDCPVFPQEGWN